MQEHLSRIEAKIDKLLETRDQHNARITVLETQAGFIKGLLATALTLAGLALSYFSKFSKG